MDWILQLCPGASLLWAYLLPRGCLSRSILSVGNKHYGRLSYSCVVVVVLVKVRVVRYIRVGGVAFGLCGSRRAVIHDVELLCAEW